jgi:hypothetical protein
VNGEHLLGVTEEAARANRQTCLDHVEADRRER